MSMKLAEFRAISDADLEALYDSTSTNVVPSLDWYRQEIERRAADRQAAITQQQNETMIELNKQVEHLTRVVTRATIVGVVVSTILSVLAVVLTIVGMVRR